MNIETQQADHLLADQLAAMNKQLIIDEGHRNPMNLEQLTGRMREWLLHGDYYAYIAVLDGEISGYCLFRDAGDHIYIRQLFVWEKFRRHGIGKTLVNWLAENVWRGRKLRIDVLCNNATGIKFWRGIGFADYCITMER